MMQEYTKHRRPDLIKFWVEVEAPGPITVNLVFVCVRGYASGIANALKVAEKRKN